MGKCSTVKRGEKQWPEPPETRNQSGDNRKHLSWVNKQNSHAICSVYTKRSPRLHSLPLRRRTVPPPVLCAGCQQSPCSPMPAKVPEPCKAQPPQGRPNAKQNKQEPNQAIRVLRFCRFHRAQLSCWGGSPVLGSGHRRAENKQTVRVVNGAAVIFGLEGVHTVRVVVVNNCERSRRRGERDGTDCASPPGASRKQRRGDTSIVTSSSSTHSGGMREAVGDASSRQCGHCGRTWHGMDAPHCYRTQHGSMLAAPPHPECHPQLRTAPS